MDMIIVSNVGMQNNKYAVKMTENEKNELCNLSFCLEGQGSKIFKLIEKVKKTQNEEYDDVIELMKEIIREDEVLCKMQKRFNFLFDKYQKENNL